MTNKLFTKTHEWLLDEDGTATIGITQHAQELLGDMVFIELPEIGDQCQHGEELGVVESVKAAADFYAPIDGEVVGINEMLMDNPAMVNEDPEGNGWLVKIKPSSNERSHLLSEAEYQNEIGD